LVGLGKSTSSVYKLTFVLSSTYGDEIRYFIAWLWEVPGLRELPEEKSEFQINELSSRARPDAITEAILSFEG
jgi:hypothetical protein